MVSVAQTVAHIGRSPRGAAQNVLRLPRALATNGSQRWCPKGDCVHWEMLSALLRSAPSARLLQPRRPRPPTSFAISRLNLLVVGRRPRKSLIGAVLMHKIHQKLNVIHRRLRNDAVA